MTKTVLETALEEELSAHLGYDEHDPVGRNGTTPAGGTRAKTVLTDVGPVTLEVPRDRDGTFEAVIVRKRQRRLNGVDQVAGVPDGAGSDFWEVSAHFAEVYGASVWRDTVWRSTEKVPAEMNDWGEPATGAGSPGDLHRHR